jgi:hypothetical protein
MFEFKTASPVLFLLANVTAGLFCIASESSFFRDRDARQVVDLDDIRH